MVGTCVKLLADSPSLPDSFLSLSLSLSLQHEDFLLALQVNEDEYKKVRTHTYLSHTSVTFTTAAGLSVGHLTKLIWLFWVQIDTVCNNIVV